MIAAINKIERHHSARHREILSVCCTLLFIHASDMVLNVHSNASYLSETKARSRAGTYMCMGTKIHGTRPNASILNLSVIVATIVDSAIAAEYAAVFMSLYQTLGELGYPQLATQIN
jgi:hypothetical protein